ncbi:MAG: tRNA 2-thiouridine(34) synthase MnmA [Vicinamibacterales bacterium]
MSTPSTRIAVAMSGGVDSSVAAALLVEQGYDVVGLSMQLYDQRQADQTFGSCCTLDDLYDARRVAHAIGFPHYILNLERQFQETVVANFVNEYAAGRTPIPCTHCNTDVKFATLLDRARGFGAEQVATGHYARLDRGDGSWRLRRSADPEKDQSYFLFGLTQEQLARARFPLGDMCKTDVRSHARRIGLGVAEKPDSQEICFVPDGDHAAFVARRRPDSTESGPIVDEQGRTLGSHGGVHRFTIGQRKGLGLSAAIPLYVTQISMDNRSVTVGPRQALERSTLTASDVNWIAGPAPSGPVRACVQIRHRHTAAPATVRPLDSGRAEVSFDTPQSAITPGQAAVFYDGDAVLGGGWID